MTIPVSNPDFPDLDNFLKLANRRLYPRNRRIFSEGENSSTLFYILSGSVSVILEDENDREIVIAYLNAGDFFGEMSFFGLDETRSATIITRMKSEVAEISYEKFKTFALGHPQVLFSLGQQMAHRLRRTTQKVADLSFLDATGRIASTLLELSQDPSAITHPDGMQIRITRQELGKISNCSREMVGRILKDLEQQGLIRAEGKSITVYGTR